MRLYGHNEKASLPARARVFSSLAMIAALALSGVGCNGGDASSPNTDDGVSATTQGVAKNSIHHLLSLIDAARNAATPEAKKKATNDIWSWLPRDGVTIAERIVLRTFLEQTRELRNAEGGITRPERLDPWGRTLLESLYTMQSEVLPAGQSPSPELKSEIEGEYTIAYSATAALNNKLDLETLSFYDVAQGMLGDCYFLATLSSVAREQPQRIRDAIRWNDDGTLTVHFLATPYETQWLDPLPQGVTMLKSENGDDAGVDVVIDLSLAVGTATVAGEEVTFPAYASTGAHSRNELSPLPSGRELWPALLEKAYAKARGGYGAIEGGLPGEVAPLFGDSTQVVMEEYYLGGVGHLYEKIADGVRKHLLMMTGTRASVTEKTESEDVTTEDFDSHHIVSSHAYRIVAVNAAGLTDPDPEKRRVSLMNPWGETEPTEAEGNAANLAVKDDGLFSIPLDMYLRFYDLITIALPLPVSQEWACKDKSDGLGWTDAARGTQCAEQIVPCEADAKARCVAAAPAKTSCADVAQAGCVDSAPEDLATCLEWGVQGCQSNIEYDCATDAEKTCDPIPAAEAPDVWDP
jgi:hypothetical protein